MDEQNIAQVDKVISALQNVIDPELFVDVVNLGLIYGIDINDNHCVITMTLTTMGCPLSDYLEENIKKEVLLVDEIDECDIKLVWYPVWDITRLTDEARRQLGITDEVKSISDLQMQPHKKIIDFEAPVKDLADEYEDFVSIMVELGFTRITIPGMLGTIGRVMNIKLGSKAMGIPLDKVKTAFEQKGYQVVNYD